MKSIIFTGKIGFVLLIIIGISLVIPYKIFFDGPGLIFMLVGLVAMVLMSFSLPEILAAFKQALGSRDHKDSLMRSAYFWEAAARNILMLGVLSTLTRFIILLGNISGIQSFFSALANTYLTTFYGVILGVIFTVPALVLSKDKNVSPSKKREYRSNNLSNITGYILFIAAMLWVILPSGSLSTFLNWPSLLVVLGGTTALVSFVGNAGSGQPITLSFAFTGLIGALMGVIQLLHHISIIGSQGIKGVGAAITFSILSCFFALLGMMVVGIPLEDRIVHKDEVKPNLTFSRIAWYGFSLVVLLFVTLAVIMVITPIRSK